MLETLISLLTILSTLSIAFKFSLFSDWYILIILDPRIISDKNVVKFPAIEENFVFFNNDFLSLAKVDEEQKQLIGAILIPDKKIPRLDKETNEEYDVFFTKETIKQAQKLFMNSLNNNNHTLEHKEPIQGLTVVESWIKEDKKYDKSNMYGFKNMPVGTWFVQVSAENNPDIWEKIKNKEVRGFSIEGYFTDKLIEASKERDILDFIK